MASALVLPGVLEEMMSLSRRLFRAAPTMRSLLPVLVAAGGVEVVDAGVGGLLDHGRIGGGHAAEAEHGDLQAGLAQRAHGHF